MCESEYETSGNRAHQAPVSENPRAYEVRTMTSPEGIFGQNSRHEEPLRDLCVIET